MNEFPWDVAALLGLLLAAITYILLAIIIYANNE